jgi:photosystem II stability/assembly factor-like uncharacterized protein
MPMRRRFAASGRSHVENAAPQARWFLGVGLALLAIAVAALLAPATARADAKPPASFGDLHWRLVGPLRGGWATCAAGVSGPNDTFYFGAADGGVWKSDDAGRTWQGLFQHEAVSSVGALAIAPSDPRVLYVGTGHPEPRWDIASGNGVYGSTDGGATWSYLGLPESEHIGKILVDPRDANVVLVAALGHMFGPNPERGVYRSEDGGKTWQQVLFKDADTGAVDLARDAANPDLVFATLWQARRWPWQGYHQPIVGPSSGIYRSRDGGKTWEHLTKGLPTDATGRIGVAVGANSGGKRVYAAVGGAKQSGIYRSDDGGDSWQRINETASFGTYYFARLVPDPKKTDTLWAMGQSLRRSDDGGKTFVFEHGAPGGDDHHDLWVDPAQPERRLIASDQGAVVTVNGGQTWSSWYNQPTGQLYHLATDDRFPYWIYSGQQDSGTVHVASRSDYGQLTFRDWSPVGGDERDYDIPSPKDPDIVFGSGLGGKISRWDAKTGQVQNVSPWPVSSYGADPRKVKYRSTWIMPIAISPLAPHPLYAAAQVMFRSLDEGKTWETISGDLTGADPKLAPGAPGAKACDGDVPVAKARACGYGVISTLAPSPKAVDQLWVGTEDSIVQLTRDGGKTWQDVSPPGLPDWSRVAQVEASPTDAATAYVAVDRHRSDDVRPYAFRTHDFGKTWTPIIGGLPEQGSVYVVRQDPVQPRLLYAGTTHGAFVSFDDGDHWQPLQLDLPTTGVNDLLVKGADLIAATQGRAIWVLDDVTPLRWLASEVASASAAAATLIPPADAVRWPGNQNRDTPLPPEEPRTPNPPAGAVLDYVLAGDAKNVTLEVLNSKGEVVHRETSTEAPPRVEADQYFADLWLKPPTALASGAGHHRVVWNLRLPRPPAIGYEYSIAAVPDADTPALPQGLLALPGAYTVRLTVDGKASTAPLTVVMDPRVKTPLADLQAQLAFADELRAELAKAVELHEQVSAVSKRLAEPTNAPGERAHRPSPAAVEKARGALASWQAADDPDDIAAALASLATDVEAVDAAPTAPQRQVLTEYGQRLDTSRTKWQQLLRGELARIAPSL